MKRKLWYGVVVLFALAVASPLWLVLSDGGDGNQAALVETSGEVLDCREIRDADACAELNRLLADLDANLATIEARQASVDRIQAAITENPTYLAAKNFELVEQDRLLLQRYFERRSAVMSTLSNLLKKYADTAQAITNNLK